MLLGSEVGSDVFADGFHESVPGWVFRHPEAYKVFRHLQAKVFGFCFFVFFRDITPGRVYEHPMANQRDKSKKLVGFYATPEEKKALEKLAKQHGITLSELLRRLATGTLKAIGIAAAVWLAFQAAA